MVTAAEPEEATFDIVETFRPDFRSEVSRRTILRGAALTGAGLIAAACGTRVFPAIGTPRPSATASLAPTTLSADGDGHRHGPGQRHTGRHGNRRRDTIGDARWLDPGGLGRARPPRPHRRPALCRQPGPALKGIYGDAAFAKLADILGAADDYPELKKPASPRCRSSCSTTCSPFKPTVENGVKVFKLTIDDIDQHIDELLPTTQPSATTSSGPARRSASPRATSPGRSSPTTSKETTGVHFHGVEFDDFFQDGVPFVTQKPIVPGRDLHLRVHRLELRFADVPLAPQRHRPGRPRPAGRVHRRCRSPTR